MADKPENKGGGKAQDRGHTQTQKAEFRDGFRGSKKPLTEQKVTSNLKPPTRPKNK